MSDLVTLSELADLINSTFRLSGDDAIGQSTPVLWWSRSRNNLNISLPMPEPDEILQTRSRSYPRWSPRRIVNWYGEWKDLEVPK